MLRRILRLFLALPLPVEQENGRHRCQRSADLRAQDGDSLFWRSRHPLDREEQYDRRLGSHQELPDMGSRALIRLRRRAVLDDENQHRGEGRDRHCHGKEGARVLQYERIDVVGQSIRQGRATQVR